MYLPKAITLAAVFGELQRAAFLKPEKGQGASKTLCSYVVQSAVGTRAVPQRAGAICDG